MAQWNLTVNLGDVFRNEDMPFEDRRDAIVARLQDTGWPDDNFTVAALLDELAEAEGIADFDDVWDAIYDEADADRVWIDTLSRS